MGRTTEQRRNLATATRTGQGLNGPVIGVAAFVLLLGTLVYLLDRTVGSVTFFAGISLADRFAIDLGPLGSSFPSFAHTFAFAAVTSELMRRRRGIALTCFAWLSIEILFEVGQAPLVASTLARLVPPSVESLPLLNETIRYFTNGTFDPWDLFSAAVGAGCAYVFVTRSTQQSAYSVR